MNSKNAVLGALILIVVIVGAVVIINELDEGPLEEAAGEIEDAAEDVGDELEDGVN